MGNGTEHLDSADRQLIQEHIKVRHTDLEHWVHNDLFSTNWWLLLGVMIVSWVIWWKFVHKKNLSQILLYGAFIALGAALFDETGISLSLWEYPDALLPLATPLFIFDLVQVPVFFTLVYQYFPKWKPYILGLCLVAAFFSFVMEPLLVHLGIYYQIKWKYAYSFPVYVLLGIVTKMIMHRILKIQKESSTT